MHTVLATIYAGFFVIDVRLALITLGLSLLCSAGTVLLIRRFTTLRQAAPWFAAGVVLFGLAFVLFLDLALSYPIFEIRSFFQVP